MRRWIKDFILSRYLKTIRLEFADFLEVVRTMSDEEIADVLALSTVLRIIFEDEHALPLKITNQLSPTEIKTLQATLHSLESNARSRGAHPEVGALRLWRHTSEALMIPEISHEGEELWREMERGRTGVAQSLFRLQLGGIAVPTNALAEAMNYKFKFGAERVA